jgi:hypothetical protein
VTDPSSEPPSEPPALDFSAEELDSIAALFGATSFPGVDRRLFTDLDDTARAAIQRAGRRALIARRAAIGGPRGHIRLTPPILPVMTAALQPSLIISAERRTRRHRAVHLFSATPQLAVEQFLLTGAVYRLIPLPTARLLRRVLELVELRERPVVEADPVVLSGSELESALKHSDEDSVSPCDALPDAAQPFLEALGSSTMLGYISCLGRDGRHLRGGSLAWVDGGAFGLWLLEPAVEPRPDTPSATEVRPVTAAWLRDSLLSLLPGGESDATDDRSSG